MRVRVREREKADLCLCASLKVLEKGGGGGGKGVPSGTCHYEYNLSVFFRGLLPVSSVQKKEEKSILVWDCQRKHCAKF